MAMDRATQCVYAMDKFVVFVVLMVLSNHMVLFANAIHPRTRFVFLEPLPAASSNAVLFADQGDLRAGKPQVLAQQAAAPTASPTPVNFKTQFIDSIFQIPISTLKAVNNLVLTITNGFASQIPATTSAVTSPAKSTVVLDSAASASTTSNSNSSQNNVNSVRVEAPVAAASNNRPVTPAPAPSAATSTSTGTTSGTSGTISAQ